MKKLFTALITVVCAVFFCTAAVASTSTETPIEAVISIESADIELATNGTKPPPVAPEPGNPVTTDSWIIKFIKSFGISVAYSNQASEPAVGDVNPNAEYSLTKSELLKPRQFLI